MPISDEVTVFFKTQCPHLLSMLVFPDYPSAREKMFPLNQKRITDNAELASTTYSRSTFFIIATSTASPINVFIISQ